MNLKFAVFSILIGSSALFVANAENEHGDQGDEQLVITGQVSYENGDPVVGGNVLFIDLQKRLLRRLEKPVDLGSVTTSDDGSFRVRLGNVEGDLYIELQYEVCHWTGDAVKIDHDELTKDETIVINLTTKHSECERD